MHIGFLTPEFPLNGRQSGGLGTYVRKTSLELYKRGHQVSVFLESSRTGELNDSGVRVYETKCPPLYYGLNSRSLVKQLIRVGCVIYSSFKIRSLVLGVHKKQPLDIIQSANYLAPGYYLRRNNKIPLICRVSSYAPLYHSAFGLPRTLGDYLIDYLELRQVTDVDANFSPSHFMQKVYARFENCNLDYVPTPLDVNQPINLDGSLLKEILRKSFSKQYVLCYGSLSRIKGIDLMAEVINILSPKYPHLSYVFIGKDYGMPDGQKISRFIYNHCPKYKQNIFFFPHKHHDRLYPVIKNALAVIAPSRVDNYPNTCLEALSLNIPVVGTSDSSIDEIIVDGETGFIAKNSSPKSIASKAEKILNMTKEKRLEMQKNIKKNISDILIEDRIGMLLSYYEKITKRKKI